MPVEETLTHRRVLIVAAHPDDETIGAGGILPRLELAGIVHITNGSPRSLADARAAGYITGDDYAHARRGEMQRALALAKVSPDLARCLKVIDQEASLDMAYVSLRLADLLKELHPTAVLTHAYEGGHPDHDAAAFAV